VLTFEIPAYFLLLIFFPLIFYFLYLRKSRGGSVPYTFNVWNGRNLLHTPLSLIILHVATEIFFWLALLSFVIALAGPSLATNKKIFSGRGMDIMIVLDQSPSMAARDFGAEDRLTTAREMIKGFVKTRENDSLGLVTFSEEALLRLPPTIDHSRLNETLGGVGYNRSWRRYSHRNGFSFRCSSSLHQYGI
jgi:Ca-activated chloride channel family protein